MQEMAALEATHEAAANSNKMYEVRTIKSITRYLHTNQIYSDPMVDILHFASLVEGFLRCRPHTDEIDCSHVVDVVLSRLHLKDEKVRDKNSTPLQIASSQRD